MTLKIAAIFKYVIIFIAGLFLLWLAIRNLDLQKTYDDVINAKWSWVWLSLVFSALAFVIRAQRWNMLIEPSGYKPKLSNTSYSVMFGYFANLGLPRLGEVTRCAALSRKEKIPFEILIGTVIVERALDMLTLLIALFALLFIEYGTMRDFLLDNVFSQLTPVKFIYAGGAAVFIFLVFVLFMKSKYSKPFREKILSIWHGVIKGFKSILKIKHAGWFIFHSLFIWILYYLSTWCCFYALASTSALGWREAIFALAVGGIGMSAPVNGGIGAYELLVSKGLMLFNISESDGITFALLVHATQILLIIASGLFAIAMMGLTPNRNARTEDPVQSASE